MLYVPLTLAGECCTIVSFNFLKLQNRILPKELEYTDGELQDPLEYRSGESVLVLEARATILLNNYAAAGNWQLWRGVLAQTEVLREKLRVGADCKVAGLDGQIIHPFSQDSRIPCLDSTMRTIMRSDGNGATWIDQSTGEDVDEIVRRYSSMKFGHPDEVKYFAKLAAEHFLGEIDGSELLFEKLMGAAEIGATICMMVPGSRNVPSASNLVFEEALDYINMGMFLRGLPSLVNIPVTRLRTSTSDYAQASEAQRKAIEDGTKSVLPGPEFFKHQVYVCFFDDLQVTGSTQARYRNHVIEMNGEGFFLFTLLNVDSYQAASCPQIEDEINHFHIPKTLDSSIVEIVNHPDFVPVQRLLKLILSVRNRGILRFFASDNFSPESMEKLVLKIIGNDFYTQAEFEPSVRIMCEVACVRDKFSCVYSKGDAMTPILNIPRNLSLKA